MLELSKIQFLTVLAIPMIFAITLHEVAHGYVANKLGDPTARMLGRITLNPIKHIDFIGTLILPILLFLTSGFIFGWAKPVPVDWRNLKKPRRDMILVAVAGPLANLLMAFFWGLIAKLAFMIDGDTVGKFLFDSGQIGVLMNIILMIFNLFPIPPLDGSRIISALLPPKIAYHYNRIEPYGFIILLVLLFSGLLFSVLNPLVGGLQHFVNSLFF